MVRTMIVCVGGSSVLKARFRTGIRGNRIDEENKEGREAAQALFLNALDQEEKRKEKLQPNDTFIYFFAAGE